MNQEIFNNNIKRYLGEYFKNSGYIYSHGCFFLNRKNGFRDIVSFDFDGNKSYRLFIGIDYPYDQEVDKKSPPEGARIFKYFTGGSLSNEPRDFTFNNSGQLKSHIERFKVYFEKEISLNYFATIKTPEDYADHLPDIECITKYEIYKNLDLISKAKLEAEKILTIYKNMHDIKKIKDFIECDVQDFLKKN